MQNGELADNVTAMELLESLPCIVYVVRATVPPSVLFVTANIESYTGYEPEDFYANSSLAFECIHPDDRESAVTRIRMAMHETACYRVEGRVCHRSGTPTYHMAARSIPVTDADGKVVLRQGVVLDITEQKRLEAALHRSQRLAAIGEMAAMMAHEIRNPLAGMSLAIRSLCSDDIGRKVRDECLDDLEECLKRINDTVSRALDFAKTRPLLRRDCSLADVLARAQRLVASYMRRNDVKLHLDLPESLPTLKADPDQLEQVFVDLILNACQSMPDGGQVTVRARMDSHVLRVKVTDTGIGIPPERLGEVFSPFYSGFSDGAGLGLSLCRRILASHDGHIRVTSTVGQGSTFHLELPQEPSHGAGPSDR